MIKINVGPGKAFPLGPSVLTHSKTSPSSQTCFTKDLLNVNVAVYAKVESLQICVFAPCSQITRNPERCIPFEHKTGDVWHIELRGLPCDCSYALRVDKSRASNRLLTDPYARWIESPGSSMWMHLEGEEFSGRHISIRRNVKNFIQSFPMLKSMGVEYPFRPVRFVPPSSMLSFDWDGQRSPRLSYGDVVIYEAHIRALTAAGTFESAIQRIPYLKWLGVTALQLMPIFEFSELEMDALNGDYALLRGNKSDLSERTGNMWGYSPLSWFSPMNRYSKEPISGGCTGLKKLVKALHAEGMECYLDVVYNHSSNSSCALHFLNTQSSYYIGKERGHTFEHSNLSGCGNTLATARPLMLELVMDSLRWWVTEYHIDGFRLDAAGILCRDKNGVPVREPHVIESMASDPVLKGTKFIVEGWDAGDQIGSPNMLLGSKHGFPCGDRFCEWNVRWRDTVRRYVRGDRDVAKEFRDVLRGSPHLFSKRTGGEPAFHGVNFVSCHDGFCMADVVSFKKRLNEDGYDEISFNCGDEGAVRDDSILKIRARCLRNFIVALAVSRGIPMILQGDEIGATKDGFSNTWNDAKRFAARLPNVDIATVKTGQGEWCQREGLVVFCKRAFSIRKGFAELRSGDFMSRATWVDMRGRRKGGRDERFVGFYVKSQCDSTPDESHKWLYVAFYNGSQDAHVKLPDITGVEWTVVLDTFRWELHKALNEEHHNEVVKVSGSQILEMGSHSAIVVLGKFVSH